MSKKNYESTLKWLEDNQNKPCEIVIMAFELGVFSTWEKGFKLIDNEITIKNNDAEQELKLIYCDEKDFKNITFDNSEMDSIPMEGDFELSTDHFTIGFRLL